MTPEDVLIESIAAASLHGDSAYLREKQCEKLKLAIRLCAESQALQAEHIPRDDGR